MEIQEVLKNYNEDDNAFKKLSYQNLNSSIYLSNMKIVLANIKKMFLLFKIIFKDDYSNSFLSNSMDDFELFKFLFSQKSDEFSSSNFINLFNSLIVYSIEDGAIDSLTFFF